VLAVHTATKEAVDKARAGGGPTLIEAVTYRLSVHTTADDPKKYRGEEEVKVWEKRDPLPRFTTYLMNKGVLDAARFEAVEKELKEVIKQGVSRYEEFARTADPLEAFSYVYEKMPEELRAQRQEYAEALKREGTARHD